jgi:TolB-like protein
MKNYRLFFLGIMALVLISAGILSAENAPVKIAFLTIDNKSADPRYDYLEGIINGILLFDLAEAEGIVIVDRSSLESVLKEQELILSDLANNEQAVKVGKILGADYLLKGQYVFLGTEVMVSISLVEVGSAKTLPFSDRGATENLIHSLSEQIILRLTGKTVVLQSEQHERSIISLKDEKPGSISLFINLVRADIFLDDEFIGYSTGDSTVPYEVENVYPGKHTVRVHLDGFGIVKQPEITFHDWEEVVEVKPGKRHVLKANIKLFSSELYDIQKIIREYVNIGSQDFKNPFKRQHTLSFQDRDGKKNTINLNVELKISEKQAVLGATINFKGKIYYLENVCATREKQEARKRIENIDVILTTEYDNTKRCYISYSIFRNDITTDMWQK